MSQSDLEAYWEKPFTVKPEIGFYAWRKITKLRLVDDRVLSEPEFLAEAFMNFFSDKSKLEKFIGESICMTMQAFRGRSKTTLTIFPSFLTTYLPLVDIFTK